jgi:hypothetical protein
MPYSSLGGESRCRDCGGSGDCQQCFGTGRNVALNSDQDKCPNCGGLADALPVAILESSRLDFLILDCSWQ